MGKEINLKYKSDKEFFMIHGYSGSPRDFSLLPEYLHKKFKANVRVPLLKGHGTKVEDLDNVTYNDFVEQVEVEFLKGKENGRKIVLVGICFGAQLALYLASKYKVEGIIAISPPYKMKFPFNIPGIGVLGYVNKYWKKHATVDEQEKRLKAGDANYSHMHANGLKIAQMASKELDGVMGKVTSPCLIVTSKGDRIGKYKSGELIANKISSKNSKVLTFNTEVHNLFYSLVEKSVEDEIRKYIEENFWKKK